MDFSQFEVPNGQQGLSEISIDVSQDVTPANSHKKRSKAKMILDLDEQNQKLKKITRELLEEYDETSRILATSNMVSENVEKNPIPNLSKRQQLKQKIQANREKRKQNDFHWMPIQNLEYNPELARDKEILQLRDVLNQGKDARGTRHNNALFQIGTVLAGNFEHQSGTITRKEKKKSISEEWLHDPNVQKRVKVAYDKITQSSQKKMSLSQYFKVAQGGAKKSKKARLARENIE